MKKLERYITPRITVKYLDYGEAKYHNIPFTYCKIEHFTKRHLEIDKNFEAIPKNTICPHVDGFEDIWKIKNSYQNTSERVSFDIEII